MEILFSSEGWNHYLYWQNEDLKIVQKINELLKNIQMSPFQGIGKPEPLRNEYKGFWSRRINSEHRLIYRIVSKKNVNQHIEVLTCRFHYKK